MGNRSKYVAMTAAAGAALVAARRRARLRHAAEGIGETILPSVRTEGVAEGEPGEGHAPGHRHLPTEDPDREPRRGVRRRPRTFYGPKERHPYARD